MDQTKIARLVQLARLKESGALTSEEFTTAKTALLGRRIDTDRAPPDDRPGATEATIPADTAKLSATWRFRLDFFDQHGLPGSPGHRQALRAARHVSLKVNA
ncbi:hypothetical protein [Sphingomonas sp.]|uniref:hypothetical protein n=1 Tax=Sphingomonas sp. TaxID=28214 RepID=UPI003AFF9E4D